MKTPRPSVASTLVLAGLGALALGFAACGDDKPPSAWVAMVSKASGQVEVTESAGKKPQAAKPGTYIMRDGRLVTGADGQAHLKLTDGGRLVIKPNSVVLFRARSGSASKFALSLEQGSLVGETSQVQASDLLISVGGRKVRLGKAAKATVTARKNQQPKLVVTLGNAQVDGRERVVTADEGVFVLRKPAPKPDAAPPKPDASVADGSADTAVTAKPVVFYLRVARGRVYVRQPGEKRFRRVRRGATVEITPDTEIKLGPRAQAKVGAEKGKGTVVRGPAQIVVRKGEPRTPDGAPSVRIEGTRGDLTIAERGPRGKRGSKFSIEGVTVETRVTHRRIEVKIRRERNRAAINVIHGEVLLKGKGKPQRLEAGQRAVIAKGRVVKGPLMPPGAPLVVRRPGRFRVFTAVRKTPVTLRWKTPAGAEGMLVEVARNRAFRRPLFSDVLKRNQLTIPGVRRGSLYWRRRPVKADGSLGDAESGRLVLLRDTSGARLKTRPPRITIDQSYGNTTAYYQNALPRFTFRWRPVGGAARYRLKVFRENNLSRPLVSVKTTRNSARLRVGRLGEGNYLWYATARESGGKLVKSMKSRRLRIRFDNATPNLQIVYPPLRGAATGAAAIEARGVAVRGSKVYVNGTKAALDAAYRFSHRVALKRGKNYIIFRVEDRRRGSSMYLRRVTRR